MNDAQIWAMIGAFTALMLGMLTVVSTLFVHVVKAEIGGLRSEMSGLRAEVNGRFDVMSARMDGLDRDVQALVKHTFGLDRE